MEAATVPQTKPEKFLVRNNTAGYIGVIEIDHRGDEKGLNIEPYGARWMSEPEMIATARASRDPADNPFLEQTFMRQDPETQRHEEYKLRPLTLEHDADRFVPSNDRYVPTQDAPQDAAPGVAQAPAASPTPVDAPPSSGAQTPPPAAPPPTPVQAQGAPAPVQRTTPGAHASESAPAALTGAQAPAEEAEAESWLAEPEAPGQVISGSLSGDDSAPPEQEAAAAPDPTDAPAERPAPTAGQAQAAPQTPGAVDEEHAAAVDPEIGEETGAAKPPSQPQPEGEFAQAEEVGSPDAPAQDANDATEIGE